MHEMGPMMDGMGGWMAAGSVFMFVALGLVVGVVWLVRATRGPQPAPTPDPNGPQEILQRRYASGDIDEDEYFRRISGLEQT